jgi:hypothetical protein
VKTFPEADRPPRADEEQRKVALTILANAIAEECRKAIAQPLPQSFAPILRKLKKAMDPDAADKPTLLRRSTPAFRIGAG